jgi:hypothetical protein
MLVVCWFSADAIACISEAINYILKAWLALRPSSKCFHCGFDDLNLNLKINK